MFSWSFTLVSIAKYDLGHFRRTIRLEVLLRIKYGDMFYQICNLNAERLLRFLRKFNCTMQSIKILLRVNKTSRILQN